MDVGSKDYIEAETRDMLDNIEFTKEQLHTANHFFVQKVGGWLHVSVVRGCRRASKKCKSNCRARPKTKHMRTLIIPYPQTVYMQLVTRDYFTCGEAPGSNITISLPVYLATLLSCYFTALLPHYFTTSLPRCLPTNDKLLILSYHY